MRVGDVLHLAQPVVDQPVTVAVERGEHAAAAEVPADDDVVDPQQFERVLQHGQAVEVGMHDEVGHVAVHEHLAGVGAGDLVGGNAAVRATDPEIARRLLRGQAREEARVALGDLCGPAAISAQQVLERHAAIVAAAR